MFTYATSHKFLKFWKGRKDRHFSSFRNLLYTTPLILTTHKVFQKKHPFTTTRHSVSHHPETAFNEPFWCPQTSFFKKRNNRLHPRRGDHLVFNQRGNEYLLLVHYSDNRLSGDGYDRYFGVQLHKRCLWEILIACLCQWRRGLLHQFVIKCWNAKWPSTPISEQREIK